MSNASNDNQSDNDDLNRYYNELDTDLTELFSLDIELENFIPENYPIEQDTINTRHSELAQLEASDRYSILDKIDEGGMKDIWRAEDSHTDRMIAFAMIKEKSIPSDERYEAFIREARLTANLQHPNIVPIYDVSVDSNGIPFFTMKALKGENLEIIIEKIAAGDESYRARFTKMNLLSIFQRVCDAVAYAHSKGIIHLDLKPSNIIVCDYGEVQVIDWGISQFVDDIVNLPAESFDTDSTSDAMQSTHTICKVASISGDDTGSSQQYLAGSPGYMSPEQISGDIESIDHRTDIYSLGAILFFIQSGTKPVTGNDIKNLLENTTSGNITPLKQNKMPNQISKVLAAITIKALALNKADRYESVHEMQLDLNNYIDGFATIAESANFITHLKLLIRRHLLVTTVTTLFLSLLTATITFSVISINKKRNEAETLLKNLKEKTAYISTLTEQVAPSCFDSAIRRYHDHEFDKYIHNLDLALSFDSSLDYIWNHKAHQFIAEQRFHQLMELFKKGVDGSGRNWKQGRQFKQFSLRKNDGEMLKDNDEILLFIDIVRRMKYEGLLPHTFHEMNKAPFDPEQRFTLIKKLLLQFNPAITSLNFSYKKSGNGWEIDISNNPELKTAIPLCGLKITTLNAENTGLTLLNFITVWGLQELSCSGSPIKTIIGRQFVRGCKRIDFSNTKYANVSFLYNIEYLKKVDLRGVDYLPRPTRKRKNRITIFADQRIKKMIDTTKAQKLGYDFVYGD